MREYTFEEIHECLVQEPSFDYDTLVEKISQYSVSHLGTGAELSLFNPNYRDFSTEAIAKQLSGIYRYNYGLIRGRDISVAEHSVMVYTLCRINGITDTETLLWALTHDAAEAYTGDIVAPFKKMLRELFPVFNQLMHNWDVAIAKHFGVELTVEIEKEVKHFDIMACQMEQVYHASLASGSSKVEMAGWFKHYKPVEIETIWHNLVIQYYSKLISAKANAQIQKGLENESAH